eukprot:GHVR01139869.1.p2 GENE.GHVR01139869.1~~GHVR01139869.1.p2  ORF type:complete len:124 (+),score=50.50 GHVR01139869.1:196-567(+)
MKEEHFGISVVESLSSGCLVVAHNSGGPSTDILTPLSSNELSQFTPPLEVSPWVLADTTEQFAEGIARGLNMTEVEGEAAVIAATGRAASFPDNDSFAVKVINMLKLTHTHTHTHIYICREGN